MQILEKHKGRDVHKDLSENAHSGSVCKDKLMGVTQTSVPARPGKCTVVQPPSGYHGVVPVGVDPQLPIVDKGLINPHLAAGRSGVLAASSPEELSPTMTSRSWGVTHSDCANPRRLCQVASRSPPGAPSARLLSFLLLIWN